MRDLVETVIGNILARERAAGAQRPPAGAATRPPALDRRPDAPPQRDAKLWKACREFEALLFQQMLAAMRKTLPHSGLLDGGFASDVQASMMDQAVAQAAARQAPLGIAAAMYRQLEASHPAAHETGDTADRKNTGAIPRQGG